MVMMKEEYFPRGGKKLDHDEDGQVIVRARAGAGKRKKSNILLDERTTTGTGAEEDGKQSEFKKKKKGMRDADGGGGGGGGGKKKVVGGHDRVYISPLSMDDISEGLLTLGKITQIKSYELIVALPGQICGSVQINQISTPYKEALEKIGNGNEDSVEGAIFPLENMFSVGQTLSLKVISVQKEGKQTRIFLTPSPTHLYTNYSVGFIREQMVFIAAVKSIEDKGYIMDIGISGTHAFLPIDDANVYVRKTLTGRLLGIGELVYCKVSKIKVHRLTANLTLTSKIRDVKSTRTLDEFSLNYSLLIPGMLVDATVMQVFDSGLKVHFLDMIGTIQQEHLSAQWFKSKDDKFIGSNVKARILSVFPSGTRANLSLQSDMCPIVQEKKETRGEVDIIKAGEKHQVIVRAIEKRGLLVSFRSHPHLKGIVYLSRINDDLTNLKSIQDVRKMYPQTSMHTARVLKYSIIDNIYILSLQESLTKDDNLVVSNEELEIGQIVKANIKFWNSGGAMVTIGKANGFIPKMHFGEIILTNVQDKFPPGAKIRARVFQFKHERNIILTAKKSLVKFKGDILHDISKVQDGMKSSGIIYKIEKFGIFIISIGGLMGIMKREEIPDYDAKINSEYFVGQTINFSVVHVNTKKKKLFFRPINAKNEGVSEESKDLEGQQQNESKSRKKNRKRKLKSNDNENDNVEIEEQVQEKKKKKRIKIDDSIRNLEEDIEEELPSRKPDGKEGKDIIVKNKVEKSPKEKKGNEKKLTSLEREKVKDSEIRYLESRLTNTEIEIPKTEDEFERALISSPNSSIVYTNFMAFYIQKKEYEKAREIARRGIRNIQFNEEGERKNVFLSLLSLEVLFGTIESTHEAFEEAIRHNDEMSIYKTMAEIYSGADKIQEADDLYSKMLEKFKTDPQVWTLAGQFAYKVMKSPEKGMKIYNRFLNLPNSKKTLIQVAKEFTYLEFNYGELEKGRSMFEALLANNPNLTDQFLVYANLLIKKRLFDDARNVFKRAISIVKGPVKVKAIVNRFLEFEKLHGNKETYDHVLECAKNYLSNVLDVKK